MTAYVVMPSDREFTHFLEWTELSLLAGERWVPDAESVRVARWEATSEQLLKVLHMPPVVLIPPSMPAPIPSTISLRAGSDYEFTDAQLRIAMASQTKETKEQAA